MTKEPHDIKANTAAAGEKNRWLTIGTAWLQESGATGDLMFSCKIEAIPLNWDYRFIIVARPVRKNKKKTEESL